LFSTPFTLIDGKTSKKFHVFWIFFNFILLYFASGVNSGNYTYIVLIKLSAVGDGSLFQLKIDKMQKAFSALTKRGAGAKPLQT
jgi:hypothetical protein